MKMVSIDLWNIDATSGAQQFLIQAINKEASGNYDRVMLIVVTVPTLSTVVVSHIYSFSEAPAVDAS